MEHKTNALQYFFLDENQICTESLLYFEMQ